MPPNGLRRPNDPPLLILVSLADGPKHGHALAKDIEGFAGVRLGPGALYGAITRLVERGLIEPLDGDDRRRPYRITPPGSAALAETLADMRRVTSARYGEELLALIQDSQDEGRPAWRLQPSAIWGGLRERRLRGRSRCRVTTGRATTGPRHAR